MVSFWTIFLIFFLPIIINPFAPFGFEQPKVIISEIAIDLFVVSFILAAKKFRHYRFETLQFICIGGLFFLTLIQLIESPQKEFIYGNIFRLQGIYLFWHLLIFSLLSSYVPISKRMGIFSTITLIILALSTFLLPTINGRAIGTLGEANALGASVVFLIPFLVLLKNRALVVLGLMFASLPILLSGSRSAVIALCVMFLFFILNKIIKIPVKTAVLICIVAILFSWYLPIFDKGLDLSSKERIFENRLEIWKTALVAGFERPITGHGFGNIQQPIRESSIKLSNNVRFQVVDSSHNFFLDLWVQGGIVGIGLLIILLTRSFYLLTKNKKTLEITSFLGVLTVLSFNPVSVVTLIAFWWLIGRGFESARN